MKLAGRLALVVALLAGVFLWRGGLGLLPVEREVTFKLWGDFATIRRVETQLYDGETLLERTQLETPTGAGFEPTMKLQLRQGTYRGLVMIWRADAGSPEVHDEKVVVDADTPALAVP